MDTQLDLSYVLTNIFFNRGRVNAAPAEKPPPSEEDLEDRDKTNELLEDMKTLPRSQEPRDYMRPVVKAIVQHSSDEDLTTISVAGYMDLYRGSGNFNKDNTRVREPRGGDIFVFDASSIKLYCLQVLSDDGYHWSGKPDCSIEDGIKRKSYYYRPRDGDHVKSANQHSFRKTIYYRLEDHACLIHYRGDHTTAEPKLKHRNAIQQKASKMIIKQRINEIDPQRNLGPTAVLEKLMDLNAENIKQGISFPRSRNQVAYYKKLLNEEKIVGGREVLNIGFLDRILGQPYVSQDSNNSGGVHKVFFLAHSQSLANMKHLLKTMEDEDADEDTPLVLHFGTAFKFGKYHLSPLLYRHPQIVHKDQEHSGVENPDAIIPLVHVLHENKSLQSLDSFFLWFNAVMKENCPEFLNKPKILVCDTGFREEYMPNTSRVFCKQDLIKYLERHAIGQGMKKKPLGGTKKSALKVFMDSIQDLMDSDTLDDYQNNRDNLFYGTSKAWNSPEGRALAEYYKEHLEKDFIDLSSNWYLDSLGLGHLANGLTNNASETYYNMIRHLKPKGNIKETADLFSLHLFSFECCLHNSVLACYFGRGEFLHSIILLVHLHNALKPDHFILISLSSLPNSNCH